MHNVKDWNHIGKSAGGCRTTQASARHASWAPSDISSQRGGGICKPSQTERLAVAAMFSTRIASSTGPQGCSQQSVCVCVRARGCGRVRDVMRSHYVTDKEAELDKVTRVESKGK